MVEFFNHKISPYSLRLQKKKKRKKFLTAVGLSPHQQLTPPSPDHQATLLCKRVMADGDIWEKLNMGEVRQGNEETESVLRECLLKMLFPQVTL